MIAKPESFAHPTAIIEDRVSIGEGTRIWDNVHVREGASLGRCCIVGEKTYIAYGVKIGDRVKINAFVYICYGVEIETGVMISAGAIFTNDQFPRATTPDLLQLRDSEPDNDTRSTLVREGATVGARAVIGSNLVIGRFAMIGMGSVVTKSVPDFHLAVGSPAQLVGWVCRCGEPTLRFRPADVRRPESATCPKCGRLYRRRGDRVVEQLLPPSPA